MVPVFALVGGLALKRGLPVGVLAGAGCVLFAAAGLLTAYRIGLHPSYATELLPSHLLGGTGVGLALPTILSAATADLPAERAATGSAVVSMARQIGSVFGVSVVVALIGTPLTRTAAHAVFQHAWIACAAASALAAVTAIGMTPHRSSHVALGSPLMEAAR